MKTHIYKLVTVWTCAVFTLCVHFFLTVDAKICSAQEGLPLFTYVSEADVSDGQTLQLDAYRTDLTASKIKIIKMDTIHIQSVGPITVNLFEGEDIQLTGMRIVKRTSSNYSLFGQTTADEDSEVTLVIDGVDIVGTIRKGTQLYSVRPLGGGVQALILREQEAFPPDEPPGFKEEMEKQMHENDTIPDDVGL